MEKSKEEWIKAYKNLRSQLGRAPSKVEFRSETGISNHALESCYGSNSWRQLVNDCGDDAKDFLKEKSDINDILSKYGKLARELKKIPTGADWKFRGLTPTESGIRASHKLRWAELATRFYDYAIDKKDWADIIHLFKSEDTESSSQNTSGKEGYVYQCRSVKNVLAQHWPSRMRFLFS